MDMEMYDAPGIYILLQPSWEVGCYVFVWYTYFAYMPLKAQRGLRKNAVRFLLTNTLSNCFD